MSTRGTDLKTNARRTDNFKWQPQTVLIQQAMRQITKEKMTVKQNGKNVTRHRILLKNRNLPRGDPS
jgi:hypothetical protein